MIRTLRSSSIAFDLQEKLDDYCNKDHRCFKFDSNCEGSKLTFTYPQENIQDLFDLIDTKIPVVDRHLYEVVRQGHPVAEYYDIDLRRQIEVEDVTIGQQEVLDSFLKARNSILPPQNLDDFIILNSSSPKKLSFHIISPTNYYTDNQTQKIIVKHISKIYEPVDTAVYNKSSIIRMIGSSKRGKGVTLELDSRGFQPSSVEQTLIELHSLQGRVPITTERTFEEVEFSVIKEIEELTPVAMANLENFLITYPNYQLKGTRLEKMDKDVTIACPTNQTGSCRRTTDNLYISSKFGVEAIRCFQCHHSYILNRKRIDVTREKSPFDYWTDDVKPFSQLVREKSFIIIDNSTTGNEKTTRCRTFLETFQGRVLVVTTTKTLVQSEYVRFGFKSPDVEIDCDRSVCCVNSLYKYNLHRYDLIIFDEITGILAQTLMGSFNQASLSLFHKAMKLPISKIILDANYDNATHRYISKYLHTNPVVVGDKKYKFGEKRIDVIETESPDSQAEVSIKFLRKGGKFIVPYNIAVDSIDTIIKQAGLRKVLHIHKDTKELIHELYQSDCYDKYDAIFYSPTITEGVSVIDPRWSIAQGLGIFCNHTSTPQKCIQALARFRCVSSFTAIIACNNNNRLFPTATQLEIHLQKSLNNIKSFAKSYPSINTYVDIDGIKIVKDLAYKAFLFNRSLRDKSLCYFRDTFVQCASDNDWKLTYEVKSVTPNEDFTEQFQADRDSISFEKSVQIHSQVDIDLNQYKHLQTIPLPTHEQMLQVKKFEIISLTLVSKPSVQFIHFYKPYRHRDQLNNLRILFNDTFDVEKFISSLVDPVDSLINQQLQFPDELSKHWELDYAFSHQQNKILSRRIVLLHHSYQILLAIGLKNARDTTILNPKVVSEKLINWILTSGQTIINISTFEKKRLFSDINGILGECGLNIACDKDVAYLKTNLEFVSLNGSPSTAPISNNPLLEPENYNHFFLNYCELCTKHIKTFKHFDSSEHKANVNREQRLQLKALKIQSLRDEFNIDIEWDQVDNTYFYNKMLYTSLNILKIQAWCDKHHCVRSVTPYIAAKGNIRYRTQYICWKCAHIALRKKDIAKHYQQCS